MRIIWRSDKALLFRIAKSWTTDRRISTGAYMFDKSYSRRAMVPGLDFDMAVFEISESWGLNNYISWNRD